MGVRILSLEDIVQGGTGNTIIAATNEVLESFQQFYTKWKSGFKDALSQRTAKEVQYHSEFAVRTGGICANICQVACAVTFFILPCIAGTAYLQWSNSPCRSPEIRRNAIDNEKPKRYDVLRQHDDSIELVSQEEHIPRYVLQGMLLEGQSEQAFTRRKAGGAGVLGLFPERVGVPRQRLQDPYASLRVAARIYSTLQADDEEERIAIYFCGREQIEQAQDEAEKHEGEHIMIGRMLVAQRNSLTRVRSNNQSARLGGHNVPEWSAKDEQELEETVRETERKNDYHIRQSYFVNCLSEESRLAVLQTLYLRDHPYRPANEKRAP
ncbi:hypothetical protein GF342_02015 [Candidatus Woesearchaeota archaeon]|nr:hypothetical protein [Candidatus Woesearchaeota archaeon]